YTPPPLPITNTTTTPPPPTSELVPTPTPTPEPVQVEKKAPPKKEPQRAPERAEKLTPAPNTGKGGSGAQRPPGNPNWGTPDVVDEFNGSSVNKKLWSIYNGK